MPNLFTPVDVSQKNIWTVSPAEFPEGGTINQKLRFLVNYAVLAPSAHNTQPWYFRVYGSELGLYADRSRAFPAVDPDDRKLFMSCGAALHHLLVAARYFGFVPKLQTFPAFSNPYYLACLRLGDQYTPTAEDVRAFSSIPLRSTNCKPFSTCSIPERDLQKLQSAANQEGAIVDFFEEDDEREILVTLMDEAEGLYNRDIDFRLNLMELFSSDTLENGTTKRARPIRLSEGLFTVHGSELDAHSRVGDRRLAEASPVLMVLSTNHDKPVDWLAAGRALDRFLLLATELGIDASFLNMPIEVEPLRTRMREYIGGRHPQVMLRIGYGPCVESPARRPVRDALKGGIL